MTRAFRYRTLLVGVDFSPACLSALERAVDLARKLESRLEVVHVAEAIQPAVPFSKRNRAAVERMQKELLASAAAELERVVGEPDEVELVTRVLTGVPSREIVDHARKINASMIVLSNTGQRALEKLLIGSTADRVLRRAQRPVLLVPPQLNRH